MERLIVVFDPDSLATDRHAQVLRDEGFRILWVGDSARARKALDQEMPTVLLIVEGNGGLVDGDCLLTTAKNLNIPVFGLVIQRGDSDSLCERVKGYNGWVRHSGTSQELLACLHDTLVHPSRQRRGEVNGLPTVPD